MMRFLPATKPPTTPNALESVPTSTSTRPWRWKWSTAPRPLSPRTPSPCASSTMIMVDDAHGEGVLGESGRGAVDHFHLHGRVDVEVGTLSKAFGVVGGFVAGKNLIIDHLRQKGRQFLFSSALTAA